MIKIGVRVIRGPDWVPSNHSDGGPGHLGTIIDLSRKKEQCTVQWDNGQLSTCTCSSDHQDLKLVFTESTVSTGFSHFAYCNVCKIQECIRGIRYKCVTCKNYDICMKCYMADEHDKTHHFVRINSRLATVIPVLPRSRSKKVKLFGFGPGASIMTTAFSTSTHSEDIGRIKSIKDIDGGIAEVEWPSKEVTQMSCGNNGLVEIKLVEPHHVGHVYIDHLPVADLSAPINFCINIGDKVCIDINIDTFQGLMQDYGGWNNEMEKIIGETGTVLSFPQQLQCEVFFDSVGRSWHVYIATLTKLSIPSVGDTVRVIADVGLLRRRQRHLWQESMRNLLGKLGRVDSMDEDGILVVQFSPKAKFSFSQSCVIVTEEDTVHQSYLSLSSSSSSTSLTGGVPEIVTSTGNQPSFYPPTEVTKEIVVKAKDLSCDDNSEDEFSSDDELTHHINDSVVIAPGLRVVRGRDWKWKNQDGGEGYLGTVHQLPNKGSCPDKCVTVIWDGGSRNTYRAGFEGSYDLRIYDTSGVAGNMHKGKKCTEPTCEDEEDEIMGFAWQCFDNKDMILCNTCYHGDKGNINSPFLRIEYPGHKGVKVPKRQMSQRPKLLGIDVGAKVERGGNWRWANQDGGPGQQGQVIALVNFSLDTDRDAAEVTWNNDHTNIYRLGYEGMVDIKCVAPGNPKFYYPMHLPELKMPEEPVHIPEPEQEPSPVGSDSVPDGRLKPGDKIQIGVDPDVLQSIHKEMKLWRESMMDLIGKTGVVQGIDGMTVSANFDGERLNLHEMALKKIEVFGEGEFVKIMDDRYKVQKLQNGHGDWNDFTRKSLGKTGKVIRINFCGDVEVRLGSINLTFNPECLSKTTGPEDQIEVVRLEPEPVEEPVTEPVPDRRPDEEPVESKPSVTFRVAVQDGIEKEVLLHINQQGTMEEKRALINGHGNFHPIYIACKNGYVDILRILLQYAGSSALQEGEDFKSTPLQIAVKEKHVKCVELLLTHNVLKDAVNDHKQSAVHLAVQNRDKETLLVLRKYNCDINLKDSLGDSPVVDAIVRQTGEDTDILKLILDWPGINLNYENKNGFSPIHIAARKGDLGAVKMILQKDNSLLNKEKSDGYTALHLAACMDHHAVAQYLLDQRGIDLEIKTKDKGQTAFLIACYYGSKKTVEVLLNSSKDCQIDSRDSNGNNGLHLCLSGPPQVMEIADIQRPGQREDDQQRKLQLEIAEMLLNKGVSHVVKNRQGKSPLDVAVSDKLKKDFSQILLSRSSLAQHQLCPLCQEDGNDVYAVYLVQPCECTLCNGCFNVKFKRCPNCGSTVQGHNKLKRIT